jgi:N-acetyl-anhydromuramyl-L-alanine amidase AmpD
MSKILNAENLDIKEMDIENIQYNIKKKKTKKTQIFLYDTGRRIDDFLMKLKYRNNGKYDDIPHYIVTKQGVILEIFDTEYSSKTFGTKQDNKLIKIALENLGWLNKNTITGVLYNWIGDPYRGDPYIKKWRNYYFWDPYSKEQLNSLVDLCKELSKKHLIPYQTVPSQGYLSNVIKFTGIVCKSNFLNIYTDINPSFNFNIFYKD